MNKVPTAPNAGAAVEASRSNAPINLPAHPAGAAVPVADFVGADRAVEWLIKDILPKGSIVMVAGEPGNNKSWVAQAMAISVATGTPFLGQYAVEDPGLVLFIDQDTSSQALGIRMGSLLKGTRRDQADLLVASHPIPPVHVDTEHGIRYIRAIAKANEIKLVVLEMLASVTSADFDENSSQDAKQVFNPLHDLVKEYGFAVLVTHHTRKSGGSGTYIARGSGYIAGAVDVFYECKRWVQFDRGNKVLIRSSPKRFDVVPGILAELRVGEGMARLAFVRQLPPDEDPEDAETHDAVEALVKRLNERKRNEGEAEETGATVRDVLKGVQGYLSEDRTRGVLKWLSHRGRLVDGARRHNAFVYWHPEMAPPEPSEPKKDPEADSNDDFASLGF